MNPPLSEDKVRRVVELRRAGMSLRQIAKEIGCHHSTAAKVISSYLPPGPPGEPPPRDARHGKVIDKTDVDGTIEMFRADRPPTAEELMAACELDRRLWIPQYFTPNVWQGYARVKVGDGKEEIKKVNLYQSKLTCKRVVTEALEEAILQFARDVVAPKRAPVLDECRPRVGEFMVAWGLWDAHLGMYAWNSETGADFDVEIATRRVYNSVDDMLAELSLYRVHRIVMPIGNDFMHFDSVRQRTAFGDHHLDTDTRFAKVFLAALLCLEYMVERALTVCDRVDLLYVPGNHDTTSSFALCAALSRRFLNDQRVTVDLGANPRKYVTHGGTLLGFDHGGDARAEQLALIFASEAREHWSRSTYREIQVGHTHQRRERNWSGLAPANGVLVRTNPALCNNDVWHHKQGLIGEPVKSVEAWRYDKVGYRGSHVAWARDDAR